MNFNKNKMMIHTILMWILLSLNANAEFKPFITIWETNNTGSSSDTQIRIGTNKEAGSYDYSIDCDGDGVLDALNLSGDYICEYEKEGVYTVKIYGEFPQIYFGEFTTSGPYDNDKLLSIEQWGDIEWKSMFYAFARTENLTGNAKDKPNLKEVKTMKGMFIVSSFNQDISDWNVSGVTNMVNMFRLSGFNNKLTNWDVSNVISMEFMFSKTSFNQNITKWDVSKVTNMSKMFFFSTFNQDIGDWNVSNVTDMSAIFTFSAFNQDISDWDISKVTTMEGFLVKYKRPFNTSYYNALLNKWSKLNLQNGVDFATSAFFTSDFMEAREKLINTFGWTIRDKGVIEAQDEIMISVEGNNGEESEFVNEYIKELDNGAVIKTDTLDNSALQYSLELNNENSIVVFVLAGSIANIKKSGETKISFENTSSTIYVDGTIDFDKNDTLLPLDRLPLGTKILVEKETIKMHIPMDKNLKF